MCVYMYTDKTLSACVCIHTHARPQHYTQHTDAAILVRLRKIDRGGTVHEPPNRTHTHHCNCASVHRCVPRHAHRGDTLIELMMMMIKNAGARMRLMVTPEFDSVFYDTSCWPCGKRRSAKQNTRPHRRRVTFALCVLRLPFACASCESFGFDGRGLVARERVAMRCAVWIAAIAT